MDIKREDYIFIDVKWKGGFKHTVPCRGYNLQSHIKFNESIFYIESFTWRTVTKKQYEDRVWGSLEVADTESKNLKTSSTAQPKRGKSQKTDGSKQSITKASAKSVTKNSKSKTQSSTPRKAKQSGLTKETTNEQRSSKGKALKENPAKGKPRTKASEDSKGIRSRGTKPDAKRASPSSKEARTELREPKVRNVRKSKKDIQGTNDSGETSLPRTRGRKAKTQ